MSFDEETRDSPAAREAQVGLPARRAAAELLSAVIDKKQPLDDVLGRSLDRGWMFDLPQRDRALARAIVATSLRRRGQIDVVLGRFLERGLPQKAGKLYPILLSGAAQLIFLKTPPHAAIDLAVRLAQWDPSARRYDKLVNSYREYARQEDALLAARGDDALVQSKLHLNAFLSASEDSFPGLWDRIKRYDEAFEKDGRASAAEDLSDILFELSVRDRSESRELFLESEKARYRDVPQMVDLIDDLRVLIRE